MGRCSVTLFPDTEDILIQMGEQIKEARLRRNIPIELIAERARVSRATVWAIEKGSPSVSMGAYAVVLHAIQGMDRDLLLIANDEKLKNTYIELGIKPKERATIKDSNKRR